MKTVKEFIEELSKLDQNLPVTFFGYIGSCDEEDWMLMHPNVSITSIASPRWSNEGDKEVALISWDGEEVKWDE